MHGYNLFQALCGAGFCNVKNVVKQKNYSSTCLENISPELIKRF
jgi:hypothetical protein